jgi:hypothetical protein
MIVGDTSFTKEQPPVGGLESQTTCHPIRVAGMLCKRYDKWNGGPSWTRTAPLGLAMLGRAVTPNASEVASDLWLVRAIA